MPPDAGRSGGSITTGGVTGTGGLLAMGGAAAMGGAQTGGKGGSMAAGGTVATGGRVVPTDASVGAGGIPSTLGGRTTTGGSGGTTGTLPAKDGGGLGGIPALGGVPGMGGMGGAGGSGGTGGVQDGGLPPKPDGAAADTLIPADAWDTSGGSKTLDDCFAGLRLLLGGYQISTKESADGKIRVRLALEVNPGTIGLGIEWRLVRFGIQQGGELVCVSDEAQLKGAYKNSRHNCLDAAIVTANGVTYTLNNPNQEVTKLTIEGFSTLLTNTSCRANTPQCASGGPC